MNRVPAAEPTIIFDFDGTIADTAQMAVEIYNRIACEYNCRTVDNNDRELLRKGRPQYFIKKYGITPIKLVTILLRIRREMNGLISRARPIGTITGAIRTLAASGYRLGIISSNGPDNVAAFLIANGIDGLFDFIETSKHLFGKDRVIKRLLRKRKLPCEWTMYVGDETRDIEAARKSRISVAAVTWGYQDRSVLEAARPDLLVDDTEALAPSISAFLKTPAQYQGSTTG